MTRSGARTARDAEIAAERHRIDAARRTPGTGTMRERPTGSGHWQLRVFLGTDAVTGKPRQVTRTFRGTKAKAKVELGRFVTEVADGKFDKTTATVGQLLDAWLEQVASSQRPRTLEENRRKIDHRIRPVLGSQRLAKLGTDTLDTAYRRWLAEGLSPTTVHAYHAILSAALRQAVKWGWIAQAPTERATPPQPVRKDMVVPTPAELSALVRAAEAKNPVLGTAVALAALTGCRRGELVALRWSDVDLPGARVRIARSLTVAGGEQHTGPTKTHAVRDLALDPIAVGVLQRRWAYMVDLSECAESALVADPYVLSYNANGATAVDPGGLTHAFAGVCSTLGVHFRFHDLRHFSVTTLIAAGIDVRTVAERHGHAQATMTLNRYAHALPERDREAANVLGAVLDL